MATEKFSPGKKGQQTEERRSTLAHVKKLAMLAVCVRNQDAFEAVQATLKVGHIRRWSEPMAAVWAEVGKFFNKYGELPDRGQLNAELHNETGGNKDLLDPEEQEEVDKFLAYAWDPEEFDQKKVATSSKYVRQAVGTARQFLEELVAQDVHRTVMREGTLPVDLPKILQTTQTVLDRFASMTEVDVGEPFPDGWDKRQDRKLFTTGVAALDAFFGGGWRGKESVLFMAPYGSCKTATVCHATANQLKFAAQLVGGGETRKNRKGEPMTPVVVLVFTEGDADEYRDRLLSNMARVPWERLSAMKGLNTLDAGDHPGETKDTEYEKTEFADDIVNKKPWRNEQQRVAAAVKLANKYLMLLNCTDDDTAKYKIGRGGMEEIANVVRGIFRKRRDTHYPLAFWVDHVSGLVDRMAEGVTDEAVIRRLITNVPRLAVDLIGKPLDAPVGLMHQLSGAVQGKGAVANYHHSDAEGSKSIAKYAAFAVTSGSTTEAGMLMWTMTKHRRRPPSKHKVVQLFGQFNRIVDKSDTHGVHQRTIMTKEEMGSVAKLGQDVPSALKKAGKKDPLAGGLTQADDS